MIQALVHFQMFLSKVEQVYSNLIYKRKYNKDRFLGNRACYIGPQNPLGVGLA